MTWKKENQGTSKIFFTIVVLRPHIPCWYPSNILMSGERDLESLSVVTMEKKIFCAPSHHRPRFEPGLHLISSSWELRDFFIVCCKTKTNVITRVSQGAISTISEAKQTAQGTGEKRATPSLSFAFGSSFLA